MTEQISGGTLLALSNTIFSPYGDVLGPVPSPAILTRFDHVLHHDLNCLNLTASDRDLIFPKVVNDIFLQLHKHNAKKPYIFKWK